MQVNYTGCYLDNIEAQWVLFVALKYTWPTRRTPPAYIYFRFFPENQGSLSLDIT